MVQCKCLHCGDVTYISLKRGTKISQVLCCKCGRTGFKRWTEWTDTNGKIRH